MPLKTIYTLDTSSIKVGPGATCEVGYDMNQFGAKPVMVLVDPSLADSEPAQVVCQALNAQGIDAVLYNQIHIEPTDTSFKAAITFAVDGKFEGFVALGGGSTIDTAKAANLYATYPAE